MWKISYWIVPIFSSLVWLAMLLGLFLTWVTNGKPHYVTMGSNQNIAYISDIGATDLKPMFIAMSAVTVVSFDLAFIFEPWLRHRGKLVPNTSLAQKTFSLISIIAAIAGAAGLILLAIFDTKRHPHLHNGFLALFIVGYIVSAIFTCAEYQRLGIHFREHRVLRISFWIKLAFILIEIALAIAFGVCQNQNKLNAAAVLEWVIALIFTFYVSSFFIDFIPAVRTRHHQSRETEIEMATDGAAQDQQSAFRGDGYLASSNGYANGYANNSAYTNSKTDLRGGYVNGAAGYPYTNGHSNDRGVNGNANYPNGHAQIKPTEPVPASKNF